MKHFLAEACQNTFVLFDCLDQVRLEDDLLKFAHQRLRETGRDDVLILLDGRPSGDSLSAQMVVFGLDGAFGEYCANGARAIAAYLFAHYPSYKAFYLRGGNALNRLERLGDGQFSVTLPTVSFAINPKFIASGIVPHPFRYVEAIEPHLVIEKEMSDEELLAVGRELNQQKEAFPLGINVNAFHFLPGGAIYVKTYERGVQRLTRSCGTGSISCAASLSRRGPVDVVTAGGPLRIVFRENELDLCGEAKV